MTWILGIVGGLLLLIVIGLVVGHLMSPEYSGRASRRIEAPPEVVFAALMDPEACPQSGSMCRGVVIEKGGDLPGWTEDLGNTVVTVRTIELDAPRRVVRELSDSVVPLKARWEFELSPDGGGTELVLVHRGRVDDGTWHVPFFRLMIKGFGMGNRGAQNYVDAVAKLATK